MLGDVMYVVVANAASDNETSTAAGVAQLLLIGAMAGGFWVVRRKYRAYRAEQEAARRAARTVEINDLLLCEHHAVRSVTAVTVPYTYPCKKGRQMVRWSPKTLALTARHLVIFEQTGSGRTTFELSDVVSTSTANGRLSVALAGSGTHQFGVAAGTLVGLEQDICQFVTVNRNGGHGASVADELTKLDELRRQGVIDAGDWERGEDLYLGKSEDARDRAARELRQI